MSTERKHHDYSPSQLQALEVCPAYQGRGGSSVAAETGTRLHAIAESRQDDDTLSDDQVSMAAAAIDFVERQKQILQEAAVRAGSKAIIEAHQEQYLPVDADDTTAGYVDIFILSHDKKHAVLIDHKFGQWQVEDADSNTQGIAYSLGLFYKFPELDSVSVYFFQPALDHVTTATFKRSDVPALYLRVKTIVERAKLARAKGDFSTAKATVPTCQFCKHIATCPRVVELVLKVGKKFYAAEIPSSLEPADLEDPKQAAIGMRLAAIVQTWSEAFKRRLNDRVLQGVTPPPTGYKLTSSQRREIVDEKIFRNIALRHLTEQEFSETLSLEFGRVEKAVSAKAPRGSKTAALDSFKSDLIAEGAVKLGEPFAFLKVDSSK